MSPGSKQLYPTIPETITLNSLTDLFADFQDAASTADRKTAADLMQKLKRSLDDSMTGGDFSLSGSQPSALEQQSKARKVDQVERVEKENGEEAEEDSKKKGEQKNHETEKKDIAGKDKEEPIEEEKDVKPKAVRSAKYISPTMQTKLTGSQNPNDEEDENGEEGGQHEEGRGGRQTQEEKESGSKGEGESESESEGEE